MNIRDRLKNRRKRRLPYWPVEPPMMSNRQAQWLRKRFPRLAGAEEFIVSSGKSFAFNSFLQAANISFPGAGVLLNMVFGRLFGDSSSAAETRAHFSNKVIRPIIDAAQQKNFAVGSGLLTNGIVGKEHFAYIYENARPVLPAAYASVIGYALSTKNFSPALQFARFIDQLDAQAEEWIEQDRLEEQLENNRLLKRRQRFKEEGYD